jgi:hypothetical protein
MRAVGEGSAESDAGRRQMPVVSDAGRRPVLADFEARRRRTPADAELDVADADL